MKLRPGLAAETDRPRPESQMNTTLDALEARRRARQFAGKGSEMYMLSEANELLQRSLDVIRTNPLPVALIGLGVAWLISNNTGMTDRVTEHGSPCHRYGHRHGSPRRRYRPPRRRYGERHQPPRRRTRHRRRPESRPCRLRRPRARAHRPSDGGPGRRARRRLGASDERPCLGRASFGARYERRPSAQGRELRRSRRRIRCVRAPSADHRRDRRHDRCADRGAAADLGGRKRAARRDSRRAVAEGRGSRRRGGPARARGGDRGGRARRRCSHRRGRRIGQAARRDGREILAELTPRAGPREAGTLVWVNLS